MKYCRLQTPHGPRYAEVRDRAAEPSSEPRNELWIERLLPPFPEGQPDSPTQTTPAEPFTPQRLRDATLLPSVTPSKIVCVGRNYRDHAAELGNEVPAEPLLFFKPPSSLLAHGGAIRRPPLSTRVDFEGEIAIVIGKTCRNLGPDEDVRPYIRGYTLVNDVSARDLQKKDGQWTRAKGFDTFCPAGPVVTDEIDPGVGPDSRGIDLETRVNGELRQQGNTRDLIFPIPYLLRYISAVMTLNPGDLIPTGTPSGVGPLQPGDRVEITVPGLGTLMNTVE